MNTEYQEYAKEAITESASLFAKPDTHNGVKFQEIWDSLKTSFTSMVMKVSPNKNFVTIIIITLRQEFSPRSETVRFKPSEYTGQKFIYKGNKLWAAQEGLECGRLLGKIIKDKEFFILNT